MSEQKQEKKKTTKRLRKRRHATMRRTNRTKVGPTWKVRAGCESAVANVERCC